MIMKAIVCFLFMLCLLQFSRLHAQIDPSPAPQYVDPTDLRMVIRRKNSTKKEESGVPEKGKLMLFVVPAIGSNPRLEHFMV